MKPCIENKKMIPPCQTYVGTYDLGPVVLKTLQSCDAWAVPHIINPFMVAVWTRSWWFGFFIAGIGELVEYTALWAFKSFIIFLGTHKGTDFNHDIENLAGSHVEDWLIQGGLGSLMGWIFYNTFDFPAMLRYKDMWNGKILKFLFYLIALFGGAIILPSAFFGVTVGDAYPFGRHLYYIFHAVVFALVAWLQPRETWGEFSANRQLYFWLTLWGFSFVFNFQNTFDWFFSSHVQTWLLAGIAMVLMGVYSEARWQWIKRIQVDLRFTNPWK